MSWAVLLLVIKSQVRPSIVWSREQMFYEVTPWKFKMSLTIFSFNWCGFQAICHHKNGGPWLNTMGYWYWFDRIMHHYPCSSVILVKPVLRLIRWSCPSTWVPRSMGDQRSRIDWLIYNKNHSHLVILGTDWWILPIGCGQLILGLSLYW